MQGVVCNHHTVCFLCCFILLPEKSPRNTTNKSRPNFQHDENNIQSSTTFSCLDTFLNNNNDDEVDDEVDDTLLLSSGGELFLSDAESITLNEGSFVFIICFEV